VDRPAHHDTAVVEQRPESAQRISAPTPRARTSHYHSYTGREPRVDRPGNQCRHSDAREPAGAGKGRLVAAVPLPQVHQESAQHLHPSVVQHTIRAPPHHEVALTAPATDVPHTSPAAEIGDVNRRSSSSTCTAHASAIIHAYLGDVLGSNGDSQRSLTQPRSTRR
jgi:hypothetical protein